MDNAQTIENKTGYPSFLWLLLFLAIPLLALVIVSFLSRGTPGALPLTASQYEIIAEISFLKPLLRSIIFAILTTAFSFLLGFPLALWIVSRTNYKSFFLFLVVLPFWTNFLVRMYGWKMILRDGGLVDVAYSFFGAQQSISFLGTPQAVLLGLIYVYLPFMVMPLYAALEKFDWSVVLAARDLGGGTFHIIRSIVLPIIEPAVNTGALFVFVLSFGDFVVSDILGGARNSMVGNAIRDAFLLSRNWPQGAAMTLLVAILLFGSFHFRRIFIR